MKAIIVISVATILIPIITMIVWSFTNNYRWPDLLPTNFGLRGWEYVFLNNSRVLNSLKNSIFISITTTLITILISIPCAKALAFNNFRGKKIVEYMVYSPIIIPAVSIGMGLNIEFIKLGLARTYLGVILVSIVPCIPYAVNMIKDVFLITGRGYIDQAHTLGASSLEITKSIVFPMILPGVISAAIMCYIVSFSQYFLVYLIGGGKIITFTMDMFPFIQSGDRMMGSVYGVIFVSTTVLLLFIMEVLLKKIYKKELEDYMFM
ncbi:MAG: ABC transporter permease subunit [Peptostreptococcus sp.]